MNINRDNYELFLMLYIDNELSVKEKAAVEAFLAENEDLAQEFAQLQETVLLPEETTFRYKEDLYRSAVDEIAMSNLLSHLDGEFAGAEALAMDKQIAADKSLNAEWQILQQTRLDRDEKVVFPDKSLLYRKTGNVIVGRFARWAVAAALLGLGFFAGIRLLKPAPQQDTARAERAVKHTGEENVPADTPVGTTRDTDNLATANPGIIKTPIPGQDKQTDRNSAPDQEINLAHNQEIKVTPQEAANDDDHAAQNGNEANPELLANRSPVQRVQSISPERESPERESPPLIAAAPKIKPADITDRNVTPMENDMARTAGLTELTQPEEANHILYINEEKISRTKAGSFFRKVKRTIARNANLRTERSFRIAGFEIAAK